jgi:hypothetical protein
MPNSKKTDKFLSVELELQQLMSALEKHQKQEDGKKTDERQASYYVCAIFFRTPS